MIEAATYHPSRWVVWIAANLLENGLDETELEACVERLYRYGQGLTLWAAAGMASELPAATGIWLTLTQLARPLRRGSQYMFAQLSGWSAPLTPELMGVLEAGLFADEVQIACAAADLAEHFAQQSSETFAAMGGTALVDRAWQHWLEHEEPYPQSGGPIPNSPRAALTRALISLGGDSDVIDCARSDSRSDVRDIAKARFRELVLATPEAVDAFLTDIENAKLPPHDLAAILRQESELTPRHIERIEAFLGSPLDSLRFNAMSILNACYLTDEAIAAHAERLHLDPNRQVSERAAGLRR